MIIAQREPTFWRKPGLRARGGQNPAYRLTRHYRFGFDFSAVTPHALQHRLPCNSLLVFAYEAFRMEGCSISMLRRMWIRLRIMSRVRTKFAVR